ncbi:hypothetical protein ACWEO1_38805 [Kitasatospora cineracea]
MSYRDFAGYSNPNQLTLTIAKLRTQEQISLDNGDSQAADDAQIALGRAQARLAELYRERGLLTADTTATPAERAAEGWERVLATQVELAMSVVTVGQGSARSQSGSRR